MIQPLWHFIMFDSKDHPLANCPIYHTHMNYAGLLLERGPNYLLWPKRQSKHVCNGIRFSSDSYKRSSRPALPQNRSSSRSGGQNIGVIRWKHPRCSENMYLLFASSSPCYITSPSEWSTLDYRIVLVSKEGSAELLPQLLLASLYFGNLTLVYILKVLSTWSTQQWNLMHASAKNYILIKQLYYMNLRCASPILRNRHQQLAAYIYQCEQWAMFFRPLLYAHTIMQRLR